MNISPGIVIDSATNRLCHRKAAGKLQLKLVILREKSEYLLEEHIICDHEIENCLYSGKKMYIHVRLTMQSGTRHQRESTAGLRA